MVQFKKTEKKLFNKQFKSKKVKDTDSDRSSEDEVTIASFDIATQVKSVPTKFT